MDVVQENPTSANLTSAAPPFSAARMIRLIGLMLLLGYLIVLGGTYLKGDFLTDRQGRPIANDFVNVFAAGRLTLDSDAASAYDWPVYKQAEVRAVGHGFDDYYGWHYPPTFLFVAAALRRFPISSPPLFPC
jgi:arabinofuranan 3-O-arabinosyltransferase